MMREIKWLILLDSVKIFLNLQMMIKWKLLNHMWPWHIKMWYQLLKVLHKMINLNSSSLHLILPCNKWKVQIKEKEKLKTNYTFQIKTTTYKWKKNIGIKTNIKIKMIKMKMFNSFRRMITFHKQLTIDVLIQSLITLKNLQWIFNYQGKCLHKKQWMKAMVWWSKLKTLLNLVITLQKYKAIILKSHRDKIEKLLIKQETVTFFHKHKK